LYCIMSDNKCSGYTQILPDLSTTEDLLPEWHVYLNTKLSFSRLNVCLERGCYISTLLLYWNLCPYMQVEYRYWENFWFQENQSPVSTPMHFLRWHVHKILVWDLDKSCPMPAGVALDGKKKSLIKKT